MLLYPCALPPVSMGVANSAVALHVVSICHSSGLFLQQISEGFCFNFAVSPWPWLGSLSQLQKPQRALFSPGCSEVAWMRCLLSPELCAVQRSSKGEAEMQTSGWIIKWCHWQPILRPDVTHIWQPPLTTCPFLTSGDAEEQTCWSSLF